MINRIKRVDWRILYAVYDMKRPLPLDILMMIVSTSGNGGAVWFFIAAILLFSDSTREPAFAITLALALSFLIGNILLKTGISRNRPFRQNPQKFKPAISPPGESSFPSGHAYSSFSAATVLFYFFGIYSFPFFFLAGAISFSRVYFSVHFPSDIAASLFLGIGTGLLSCVLL